jgi:hypothetical protein
VFEEREEGFAVRAGVKALAAVARKDGRNGYVIYLLVQVIEVRRGVEEAFGAEEEA